MSQTALPNIGVNYDWEAGEDGWKDGMDLNLLMADAFMTGVVVDQVNADPWASSSNPAPGKMYIIGSSPTGATAPWNTASAATIANKLAIATGDNAGVTRWHLVTPKDGWTFFNQTTQRSMTFRGAHGSGGLWYNGQAGLPNTSTFSVIDLTLDTPPGSPAVRDAYIVAATGSGAWAGHDGHYTWWDGVAWRFITPVAGDIVRLTSTGESYRFDGTNWVEELYYLSKNGRGFAIINVGNDGAGPFSSTRAAPSYTFSRDEAASKSLAIFGASMLGAITFDNTASGAIAGNGTIGNFSFAEGAPEETWTLVCTAGGPTATFSVTGSVSGAKANATVGTSYDNGVVAFDLTDGSVDFSSTGDADRIVFTAAAMELSFSAADADVIPAVASITTAFATGPRFKVEAGGAYSDIYVSDGSEFIQAAPLTPICGSLLASNYSSRVSANKAVGEVRVYTANHTLTPGEEGKLLVMDTTGGALTLTIPSSPAVEMLKRATMKIFHKGSNTLTISGAVGVTLIGTTTGTTNKMLSLVRDDVTNTWYCG